MAVSDIICYMLEFNTQTASFFVCFVYCLTFLKNLAASPKATTACGLDCCEKTFIQQTTL